MMEEEKMAKFCAKCGKQLGEQVAFCPVCGAKVSESESQQMCVEPQQSLKPQKNHISKKLLVIVMVMVVVIGGAIGIKSLISPGYMRPINLIEKGLNNLDAESIYESLTPETKKIYEMSGCKDIVENYQCIIAESAEKNDIKISITIDNKEKIEKDELSQTLGSQCNLSQEEEEKVSAAYIMDSKIVCKSGESVLKEIPTQLVVVKISGKWYIADM